jgi:transcriptional regulator with XRE-family HTH domain
MSAADLRRLRELLKLTQAQLADRLGMHANTVARMERGELPVSARTAATLRLLVRE